MEVSPRELTTDKTVKENKIPIACKINDSKNMSIATIAGEELVKFIPVYNFLGRIDAQACLQPGVAEVLLDLLEVKRNLKVLMNLKHK